MSKDTVKGVRFTEEERKLCIKALLSYRESRSNIFSRPSTDYETKILDVLIDDFKGPSWGNKDE